MIKTVTCCPPPYHKCNIKGGQSEDKAQLLANKSLAVKDNIFIGMVPLMNGSRTLEGFVPGCDATVVERILNHGGTIVGNVTCENLCLSGVSYNTTYGPVGNPWNTMYSAGGSSSGSGVVVAVVDVDMALGGDQGGSIRVPSSCCGIVGLKPTYGLVPYTGIISIVRSIDHVGPMARNVTDCARLLTAIAKNCCSLFTALSPFFASILFSAVQDQSIDGCGYGTSVGGVLSSTLSEKLHDGLKTNAHTLHDLAKQVIVTSTYVKKNGEHIRYKNCTKGQTWFWQLGKAYNKALEKFDVLLMPTLSMFSSKIPSPDAQKNELVPADLHLSKNTVSFEVTHHPAITLNAGYDKETNLPIGLQLVGRLWDDVTVLKAAKLVENVLAGLQKPFNFTK